MKEKGKLIRWIKKNRKALIATGISIGVIIAIILGINNKTEPKNIPASLRHNIAKTTRPMVNRSERLARRQVRLDLTPNSCTVPYDVSAHLRNLHDGWHASADKIATALDNGFVLSEGQTWVEAFTKGNAA